MITENQSEVEASDSVITLNHSIIKGNYNKITGNDIIVRGNNNVVQGKHIGVIGCHNMILGDDIKVHGDYNTLRGSKLIASGENNKIIEFQPVQYIIRNDNNAGFGRSFSYSIPCKKPHKFVPAVNPNNKEKIKKDKLLKYPKEYELEHDKEEQDEAKEKCVICLTNKPICICYPCNHVCVCVFCARTMCENKKRGEVTCPKCREQIKSLNRIF